MCLRCYIRFITFNIFFILCLHCGEHSTQIQKTSWFSSETWVIREIRPVCDSECLLLEKRNKLTIQARLQTAENINRAFC